MSNKRASGLRAIGAESSKATSPIRRKRGFFEASVFSDWNAIVGPELGDQCVPMRLARGPEGEGGTLHVRVTGPLALELQHLEPQVIERINSFYGFRAIARLRMHQGPIASPIRKSSPIRPKAAPEELVALHEQLKSVTDPELRRALKTFGESVIARKSRHRSD
ncbi:MAG: DciA family protein [Alphaproteobacteria bacterium]|nr:DciA family protein [Alphaproteobacteria bacterium]